MIIQRSFFFFLTKTYIATHQQNHLDETVLIWGHNVCFNGAIRKIIPVTSSYLDHSMTEKKYKYGLFL